MSLSINTNIQALNSQYFFYKTNNVLSKSLQRLSSGIRINTAADDASGLMIADSLKSKHTSIGQAIANANDGINIAQIADGALEESINIVNTIRTKSIQAASDSQNLSSRKAIQSDIDKLIEELEAIADTTVFNGKNLLDGSFQNKVFHVGAGKDETIKLDIGNAKASKIGAIAYAKTNRTNEAAVSSPFLEGDKVTAEALSEGDISINGTVIEKTTDHYLYYDATSNYKVTSDSAMAKAQAINEKINQTGVQAKAVTKTEIAINGAITTAQINGISITGSPANATEFVNFINNNTTFQNMSIRAENIGNSGLVRIIADDGRDLVIHGDTNMSQNGIAMSANDYITWGTLTLSNSNAMTTSDISISKGTINAGDLVINGVDIASEGALKVKSNDYDRTLVNSINGNEVLQKMGIRAELITVGETTATTDPIPPLPDGSLDTSFGTNGMSTQAIGTSDKACSAAIQNDGKVIIVGSSDSGGVTYFTVTRFNSDGTYDTSATTDIVGVGNNSRAEAVIVQPDGKILVGGWARNAANTMPEMALARYNSDLTLDASFGTGGKVIQSLPWGASNCTGVLLQSNQIIATGATGSIDFFCAEFNSDGSFNNANTGTSGQGIASVMQQDNKIVVAGYAPGNALKLVRFNSDTSFDQDFDPAPNIFLDANIFDKPIVTIQSDGKIIAVAKYNNGVNNDIALVRYNTDGTLDNTFGNNGEVFTDVNGNDYATSVKVQSDGKIIVTGASNNHFVIAKYNTDGTLDTSFNNGIVTTNIGASDSGTAVLLQSDNKIIVAGNSDGQFAVARYINPIQNTVVPQM